MSAIAAPVAAPRRNYGGRIAVLGMAAALAFIGVGYIYTLPARWLRAFAEDIAARAALDPNPPLPEDTRQASNRGPADNPLICMTRLPIKPWDSMVVVTSAQKIAEHPVLGPAQWDADDRAATEKLLPSDSRYQMIVLLKDRAIVAHELFYTFWGDLSALTRPEGFTRDTAIFTAAGRGGIYVLQVADGAVAADCPK